jgi:hypothetical protein
MALMWLGIIELVKKILDFVTPWSSYWVGRKSKGDQKKEDAQKRMDDAAKKGDFDAFNDSIADKYST